MRSPGSGVQQREKRNSALSTPRTRTPRRGPRAGGTASAGRTISGAASAPAPFLDPLLDVGLGIAGAREGEPVAAGAGAGLAGDDLHDVAGVQPVRERDQPATHFGTGGVVADFGVDAEGEVDGRGPGGQVDHVTLGGEDEDLVLEEVELDRLDEGARILPLLVPLHDLARPGGLALG